VRLNFGSFDGFLAAPSADGWFGENYDFRSGADLSVTKPRVLGPVGEGYVAISARTGQTALPVIKYADTSDNNLELVAEAGL